MPLPSSYSAGGRRFTIRPNVKGIAQLRSAIARGVNAVILDAETEAKREAPVRGGYRSFRPGTKPIGGTLRRSIHSATFLDGRQIAQHREATPSQVPAGSPAQLPEMVGLPGRIVAYVGTNSGYGAFVELGTVKMAPRPFLAPGLEAAVRRAPETLAREIRRAGG